MVGQATKTGNWKEELTSCTSVEEIQTLQQKIVSLITKQKQNSASEQKVIAKDKRSNQQN